jgi:hypothetical protein
MLHELNGGVYKVGQGHTDFIFGKHCKWISRLEDEMERERETTEEHTNKDAVFYSKRRRRTQAREDRVHREIEIATIKLGL